MRAFELKQHSQEVFRRDPAYFLSALGIEIKRTRKDFLSATCPFHDDTNPSFSVNRTHGGWICFSGCGQGDLFDLVARVHGLNSRTDFKKVLEIALNAGRVR